MSTIPPTQKEYGVSDETQNTTPEAEEAQDIVTLLDEEGKGHDFYVVDIIEVESKDYALLLPVESDNPKDDEVLVLRCAEDKFEMIEDDAEFQRVVKVLEEMSDDEDDDEDETQA